MRIMALDIGDRTIGVACSDEGLILASPVETIKRRGPKADSIRVAELVKERGVARVIAGLPLTLRGAEGPQSAKVQEFVDVLRRRLQVPVEMFDERLTTREAERTLIAADLSRSRRKEVIDQMAAVLILQTWLDARAGARAQPGSGR
jgi:putative Holliday junction resolvase